MTRSLDRLVNRARRTLTPDDGYRGFVDGLIDDRLIGWVFNNLEPGRPIRVGLFTAHGLIAEEWAHHPRMDVQKAGFGVLNCGFSFRLDDDLCAKIHEEGDHVILRTMDQTSYHIGSHRFAQSNLPPLWTRQAHRQKNHFHAAITEIVRNSSDRPVPVSRPAEGRLQQNLFASAPTPRTKNTSDGYEDFVLQRAGWEDSPNAKIAKHYQYLSTYPKQRPGLRVPLSEKTIDDCNALTFVNGFETPLSALTLRVMEDTPFLRELFKRKSEDEIIFWWAIDYAHSISCEDCLIPQTYIDRLSSIPPEWQGRPFAPNRFILQMHQRHPALRQYNLTNENDRRSIILSLMLLATCRPDYLLYLPEEHRAAALSHNARALADFVAKMDPERAAHVTLNAYQAALARRQFDLETTSFRTRTSSGHRLHAPALPSATSISKPIDIQIIGPFEKCSGLGQATRLSAEVMTTTGLTTNFVNFDLDNPSPRNKIFNGELSNIRSARMNLIHLNAEALPALIAYETDVFSNAYNIGYFFWELNAPATCHSLGMQLVDEIWTASKFGADIYAPFAPCPITEIGMSVGNLPDIGREEARAFVNSRLPSPSDAFRFLLVFDSFSFVQRKNPLGAIRAYLSAFGGDSNTRLIIKTQNREKIHDPAQRAIWAKIDVLAAMNPKIDIIDETMHSDDVLRLIKGCDCFLSLHRAEGFGFGMLEAMALSVPVVATGYSGNLSFCKPDNSWLVDYRMTSAKPDEYLYVSDGHKWADPDISHAAGQMRSVYADTAMREARCARALALVEQAFSNRAIGERFAARINAILENRPTKQQ